MKMFDLSEAQAHFSDLLTLAEEYFANSDYSSSAALAQIAARCAFPYHVGLFGSPRLERLLLDLGKQIPTAPARLIPHHNENSRNILHVLTYGRPIGGDSRFVWRWIQADSGNRHSVAITTQAHMKGICEVPEVLRQAAEKSGGFLWILNASASKPLEQARELRVLCQGVDIVILHLWPYDIVPILSLAVGCDSVKTLFVNHSDHTFWVGGSVAHLIVHLRRQSPHFLDSRRRLYPDQSSILPIPLDYSPPLVTSIEAKIEAKRRLGYGPDVVLLLTIATPFKYDVPGQINFLELVTPVLLQFPQAVLLAVGPKCDGAWNSASIQTNGRIVPLGTVYDNSIYRAAADVYLDSVPFSSITSLLESGISGIPLLGFSLSNFELGLLGPGAPGLEGAMEMAVDAETYRSLLIRLISDSEFRRLSGQRIQRQIVSLHSGSGWIHTVHELYAKVEQASFPGCIQGDDDTFETGVLDLALVQLYAHEHDPTHFRRLIRNYVGALSYGSRLSITRHLHLQGFEISLLNLLPPPVNAFARSVGRRAKNATRRIRNIL